MLVLLVSGIPMDQDNLVLAVFFNSPAPHWKPHEATNYALLIKNIPSI